MEEKQRLEDKKTLLNALRTGKTGIELCQLYQDYFKRYFVSSCIVDNFEKNGDFEKNEPYDTLTAPLLSFTPQGG